MEKMYSRNQMFNADLGHFLLGLCNVLPFVDHKASFPSIATPWFMKREGGLAFCLLPYLRKNYCVLSTNSLGKICKGGVSSSCLTLRRLVLTC